MKLVIAEKPSVAEYIAHVIGATEVVRSDKGKYWKGNGYLVTNCVGHLVTLAEPHEYDEALKKWDFDTLPFLPEKYKFRIINETRQQYNLVKSLMLSSDVNEIIVATDAGREGCAIYGYVAGMVGNKKPEKRLWISSMTEKTIQEGMKNLIDNREMKNLYIAALMRAEADFAVGINATRYYSIRYGGFDNKFPCGRVQTSTLALICQREQEITAFTPRKFYELYIETPEGLRARWIAKDGTSRLDSLTEVQDLKTKIYAKTARVTELTSEKKSRQRPKLYNLNDLQREGNKRYGYSAKKVLDIIQKLYEEYKIVTYPRTDSRHLNADMQPLLIPYLQMLCSQGRYCEAAQDVLSDGICIDKNVIDDSKVSDHHALLFTEKMESFDIKQLSEDELNMLDLIVIRFMEALSQKMEYQEDVCFLEIAGETFRASRKNITKKGFLQVTEQMRAKAEFASEYEKDFTSSFNRGWDNLSVDTAIQGVRAAEKEGTTTPAAHYTDDTILKVMENPYLQMSGEDREEVKGFSLGTSATRGDILEKLVQSGYIERKKKNLLPTEKGIFFINHVDEVMKNPLMTASWEQKLQLIAEGKYSPMEFMSEVRAYVRGIIKNKTCDENSPYRDKTKEEKDQAAIIGKCPLCGAPVKETKYGFCCTKRLENKDSCNFNINKEDKFILSVSGHKMNRKMAESIITNGKLIFSRGKGKGSFTCKVQEYKGNCIQWEYEK